MSDSLQPMDCSTLAPLSSTISQSLLKCMSIESVMLFNHLILCHPLLLPSIFPTIRVFSNESALCIRQPKYWSFSFSIRPSKEYSGLISLRIDWFDLCCPRDSQESSPAPQFQSTNFWHAVFFMFQLSHLYITTGKIIPLTRWTYFSKVMSLLLNMLSRFVIAFFPRSKCLLILRLQSPSAVILEFKKIKSVIAFTFFPFNWDTFSFISFPIIYFLVKTLFIFLSVERSYYLWISLWNNYL